MVESRPEITQLLQAHGKGERGAFDRLVPLIYQELRRIAHGQLGRGRPGQTLDTTALVHEAYVKLAAGPAPQVVSRGHFFAIAARAMRQIIVDYARERHADKRGGGAVKVSLEHADATMAVQADAESLLALDAALERLSAFNPRLTQVTECRYFAGLTEEETAEVFGVSKRTVQRDWLRARAWLKKELSSKP